MKSSDLNIDKPNQREVQSANLISQLLRLWMHLAPKRRLQFGILFLVMIATSFAEAISIGVVVPFLGVLTAPERVFNSALAQPIIHILGLSEPKQLLLPLTLGFVLGALISGSMRLILLWGQTHLGNAVGSDLSISIYRRTLFQAYEVHVARNSSVVIAGITSKVNTIVYHVILPTLTILSSVAMAASIMVVLLAVEPTITMYAFIGFGMTYACIVFSTKKALLRNSQKASREEIQILKTLQEGLGGIRDVLIDGTQATYCDIYRNSDLTLRHAQANIAFIGSSPRYLFEAIGMVLIAVFAFFLARSSGGIANAIPILGALAIGAQRLLPMLQQAYYGWSNICGAQISLESALDLLDQPLPESAYMVSSPPIRFQDEIALRNLSFRYSSQGQWALQDLNLIIPKGGRIGFMGTTGSGKSTLLDIIMGLLQPTSGTLAVDGVVISAKNSGAWQAHIAHVPQSIYLTDATLAENIAFGVPLDQIDISRVYQAAKDAQIADIIESWEKKYHTVVGERGVRLSGGQRQRIGIARALYKKADVLVFDEATSALDSDTESDVMRSIERLGSGLTIVIVAHRLTTLKVCTHVIDLENGKIKRSGTFENMISWTSENGTNFNI